ncbi:MAG: recombinase family protein [Chloroflexota bacterium]
MTAVGYLRQSRRADQDVALSPEQQRRDIEALAAKDGEDLLAIYEDLGRSGGRGKERLRPGYRDLLAAIETGRATTVYTKTLTRLGRSVPELYRVLTLAEEHGVRIVTAKEGVMDPGTPMGKAQFGMLAVFAEFERDLAVERAKDNVAERRRRGEAMGRRPYGIKDGEDPARVVQAYRDAGAFTGAARRLNEAGVPSALGRKWTATAVRLIVEREAPDMIPRRAQVGAKAVGGFRLYRLLACPHDGRLLTARHSRPGRDPEYRCKAADVDPSHPSPRHVMERDILPWVEAEAARYREQDEDRPRDLDIAATREGLRAQRARVLDMYQSGDIDRADKARRLKDVDAALARLSPARPAFDRSAYRFPSQLEPAEYNRILRQLLERVELGPDMRPVRAVWVDESWRSERL